MSLLVPSNIIIGILNTLSALQIFIFNELRIHKCTYITHMHIHTHCSPLSILIESLHSLNNTMLDQTVFRALAY